MGNDGDEEVPSPAAADWSVAVGAMDNNTVLWTVLDNISSTTLNYFYTSSALSNSTYPTNWSSTTWHAGDNITR
jgi:hypothetical protein